MRSYVVSISAQPGKSGIRVETDIGCTSFLGLDTPLFSQNLAEKLQKKCGNGDLIGMETTLIERNFLLWQSYTAYGSAFCTHK